MPTGDGWRIVAGITGIACLRGTWSKFISLKRQRIYQLALRDIPYSSLFFVSGEPQKIKSGLL